MSRIEFDPADIRALAEILAGSNLTEIEIADGESRIRVARTAAPVAAAAPAYAPPPPAAMPAAAPPPVPEEIGPSHPGAVTSPMVGVAYLSAEPGAASFVSVGQAVAAGQTLMLIEAMKTFNQIKAPRAGTVRAILVASSQPVEFGEVLAVVD